MPLFRCLSMPSEISLRCVAAYRALYALIGFLCLVIPVAQALATDVRIVNQTIHPYSGGDGEVEFDLAWDNSWRVATEPYNWDAGWAFCKIRRNGGEWEHLKLKTTGHTIPQSPQALTTAIGLVDTGAAHDASTNPAVGIFIYRTNDGFGTVTANDLRLRWSYADNGASSGDVIDIRVVGVEVVYIPAGSFYAGDGSGTTTAAFREKETTDNDPWLLSSESAITTTSGTSGNYYYPGANGQGDAANSVFTIPAAFPKGYGAFYMAKGELSQNSWVAFFNTLTSTQRSTRDITGGVYNETGKASDGLVNRNNVSWTSGEATLPDQGSGATYAGVAMNFISWADLTAFFDWSGLRPMSELEYEKAGRGHDASTSTPKAVVSGEYAWGSPSITRATSVSNAGLRNERGHTGSNANVFGSPSLNGPLLVGSFAKGVNTRVASGGGFYGVMELSGNLYERSVTIGNSTGRSFEGRYHGNGILDTSGDANVTSWPGTNAVGTGFRGGHWGAPAIMACLSARYDAAAGASDRLSLVGGRGVRSAPVNWIEVGNLVDQFQTGTFPSGWSYGYAVEPPSPPTAWNPTIVPFANSDANEWNYPPSPWSLPELGKVAGQNSCYSHPGSGGSTAAVVWSFTAPVSGEYRVRLNVAHFRVDGNSNGVRVAVFRDSERIFQQDIGRLETAAATTTVFNCLAGERIRGVLGPRGANDYDGSVINLFAIERKG